MAVNLKNKAQLSAFEQLELEVSNQEKQMNKWRFNLGEAKAKLEAAKKWAE